MNAASSPFEILKSAIKAVPAVKYALGIAGIIAAIAIIKGFKVDFRIAIFGVVIMFVLMTVLVIFARIAATSTGFLAPTKVFTWFSLFLTMATATALFTSVFFKWPVDLQWILQQHDRKDDLKQSKGGHSDSSQTQATITAQTSPTQQRSLNNVASPPKPTRAATRTNPTGVGKAVETADMHENATSNSLVIITLRDEYGPVVGAQIAFCGGPFDSDNRTNSHGVLTVEAHDRIATCLIAVQADCCISTEVSINPDEHTKTVYMQRKKSD
jgi:hypothetical protein